ncbi:Glutamyl-tRNA(Gln) amidotransferase subunit A [Colletotrichum fructicola]|nr:Glutamyl-tRNA(Gln) amidotransferase subunit A [Colletotrichum fructicola]KAF4912309.1 Glutamyl-tRNA(Gln) amidotransferase subunit A [Colletotrichum fructicola]KAF4934613.1 Glutamyl-tRNA(Gln) amidotransferase subunit A [Colletotrichum fructicola]
MSRLPDGLIAFGPNANCTLELCPIEWSILQYRPSVPASAIFISLFAIALVGHAIQGIRSRTWGFMGSMISGCILEIVGYIGRLLIYDNPFNFEGFLMQIVCITVAPVFFSAAIYVLLSQTINHLDPSLSRVKPKLFYWIFIPADVVSLILQAVGGGSSSVSTTKEAVDRGVNISLAGLVFQVFSLVVFAILFMDYMVRYNRSIGRSKMNGKLKFFLLFLGLSTFFILLRCVYRIVELHEGYFSHWFRDEALFIALESAVMVIAVFCLNIGHPGLVFGKGKSAANVSRYEGVAMEEAQSVEAASIAPPTAGSTKSFKLAVKDNIATQDLPTTCSSAILSSHKSPYEATIVRQLRERGARVVGKTNMDEFGMGSHSLNSIHGPVLNPLSSTPTSAGGSSGGSAVAVQTGDADVALGTDTGGSIRLPAAYCGVVGYKPSYGILSRWGVVPYANSLDTVGLLAREVGIIEDIMFSTGLDVEHDAQDPTSISKSFRKRQQEQEADRRSRLRVGIPLEYNIEELDPKIRAAWTNAATLLQKSGVDIVPVSLPSTKHALSAYYVIAPAEASSNLAKYDGVRYGTRGDESDGAGEVLYSKTRGLGFGDEVKRRILLGAYSLSSEAMDNYFIQAQRVRKLVQRDFDRVFRLENPLYDPQQFDLSDMKDEVELQDKLGPSQVDFLLCPTAPTFAPRIEDIKQQTPVQVYMNDVFTVPASLAGLPAISIPTKVESPDANADDSRKVAGLQLIGQYWDDRRLLGVAKNLLRQLSA